MFCLSIHHLTGTGLFLLSGLMNDAIKSIRVQHFGVNIFSIPLGIYLGVELLGVNV